MGEKALKPAIRFKGFTDPWEQRKVGDVIEDYIEKTTVQNQYPVLTSSQQQGIVLQEDYFADRQVTTSENIGYYVLPRGYFTYRSRSDTDVFVFNRNDLINKGIISYYYPVFSAKEVDSNFLLRRLNYGIRRQPSMAAEGTGQHVLAHSKFKNMEFLVPSVPEQERIGTFFEQLDNLITLHQRKYDNLLSIKKSMLEKMFPRDGTRVPEIRFKGFTDPWEQRKFGEVASSFEYGLNAAAKEFDGVNKYLRITDIDDSSRVFKNDDLTSPDTDLSTASSYQLHDGEILFARTGASVGKSFIYRESDGLVYFAGFLIRAKIKPEYDPEFVFQNTLGVPYEKYIQITSQRSGQPGVNAQEYAEYTFLVPEYLEQKKIGGFLHQMDNLITLHQRKLEKLKNIKKSMLEKMFV